MFITITGPSGVGKTTLYNSLLQQRPELKPMMRLTTRAPRPTDEKGYEYVTDDVFDQLEKNGELMWAVYPHGKKYGVRTSAVDEALAQQSISILVIDAVQKLHSYAPNKIIPLYIHIDDEDELRKRFHERGDMTEAEIESRIIECRSWNKEARGSGVPFVYLDGQKSREDLLTEALKATHKSVS